MKRLFALCLAACLLAGCGAPPLELLPRQSAAPGAGSAPAPTEAPARVLEVYDPEGLLSEALAAYTAAQNVPVEQKAAAEDAVLAVSSAEPSAGAALDLAAQTGLVRVMAGLAGGGGEHCYGLPLGGTQYGYLASPARLSALLGEGFEQADLQKASYAEWEAFVAALAQWIEAPAESGVTLNGRQYALPAQRPEALAGLRGVFAVAGEDQFFGPVFSPVLGTCYKTVEEAAAGGRTEQLTGALNSLWSFLELESAHLAGPSGPIDRGQGAQPLAREQARQAYADGTALFYRAPYSEALACGVESTVLPLKFSFDETDLHGGYSLEELAGQPVLAGGGWITIPAAAAGGSGQPEAEAFLLWLYASEQGRKLAPKPSQATGLPDLSGALPAGLAGAARSQGEALLQKAAWQKADRAAYAAALLEQLH